MRKRRARRLRDVRGFDLSGVLRLAPADPAVVPALLACVCTGVPLIVLLVVDRLDIAAYAAFGAFTGLFGRNEPYRQRAQTLTLAALTLIATVALAATVGALTASGVAHILLIAAVAGVTKLFLDAVRAGIPGALMPTFAAAVTVTTVTDVDRMPVAVGLCAIGAAWSWLVCMSPRLLDPDGPQRIATARALLAVAQRVETAATPEHDRTRHAAALALERAWHAFSALPPGRTAERFEVFLVHAETVMRRTRVTVATGSALPVEDATECRRLTHQLRRGALPTIATSPEEQAELAGVRVEAELLAASDQSLMRTPRSSRRAGLRTLRVGSPGVALAERTALAAAVAGLVAAAVGLGYSYWASVSAVAILAAMNLFGATHRAVQRGIGTAAGVLIGVAALVLHPGPAAAVVMVIVCSGLAELTVARNYAFGVLFATPVALLLAALAQPVPPLDLARDRLLDTAVGTVVAVAVALLLPNRGLAQALQAAVDDAETALEIASAAGPEDRIAAARALAVRLSTLRTTYDTAAGEPWSDHIPVEKVLTVERRCHTTLARLTQ